MHILKTKSKTKTPRAVIYYDTETKTIQTKDKHRTLETFRLGVAEFVEYDSEGNRKNKIKPKVFTTLQDFHQFIIRKVRNTHLLYVIAHNLDFDFEIANILQLAKDEHWQIQFFAISQGVFTWKFKGEGYKVIFMDSGQFFKSSLRTIGKIVGLNKMPMPDRDMSDEIWMKYCTRDVDVLRLAMEKLFKFIRDNDLGKFKLTIASQALEAYKHRFQMTDVLIHQKDWITNDEIKSYHGGRTEPFFIGKVPERMIYDLDVNSLYPFVMRSKAFPVQYLTTQDNITVDQIPALTKEFDIIADVEIDTPENYIPVKRDKLIFPIGKIRGWYTTPEIRYAYENGYLKKIHRVYVYKKAKIFVNYVDFFYQVKAKAKAENNPVYYKLAKLFLNSLYGKFGQRAYKYTSEKTDIIYDPHVEQIIDSNTLESSYRLYFNDTIWYKQDRTPSYDTFVSIASHITAHARMYLWKLMKIAGLENVYYCDTDSIFTNKQGVRNLKDFIDNDKLGMLKVEKVLTDLVIYGPKDYKSNELQRIKGISSMAKQLNENRYQQIQFERFLTRLHKSIHNKIPVKIVTKKLSRTYEKARVMKGGRCYPLELGGKE